MSPLPLPLRHFFQLLFILLFFLPRYFLTFLNTGCSGVSTCRFVLNSEFVFSFFLYVTQSHLSIVLMHYIAFDLPLLSFRISSTSTVPSLSYPKHAHLHQFRTKYSYLCARFLNVTISRPSSTKFLPVGSSSMWLLFFFVVFLCLSRL